MGRHTTLSLDPDTRAALEEIARRNGLTGVSGAIRFLAARERYEPLPASYLTLVTHFVPAKGRRPAEDGWRPAAEPDDRLWRALSLERIAGVEAVVATCIRAGVPVVFRPAPHQGNGRA